jgi:hypothetical protein
MKRRFAILATALIALNAFFWIASLAVAAGGGGGPLGFLFGNQLVRAEVVLRDGSVYDVYRGRLGASRQGSLLLREPGGQLDTFQLDASTRIVGGQPARGLRATVVRLSNGPVKLVVVGR